MSFGSRPAAGLKGGMALIAMFLLGVANFALHGAVLASGHPLFDRLALSPQGLGRKLMLGTEFLILMVAMLLVASGWEGLTWAYLAYTCANGATAWLIMTGRV